MRYKCCQPLFCSVPCGRNLQGRGAFLFRGFLIPSGRNVIASLAFLCPCGTRIHTNENRRKCPVASDSGITRRPKIPIIFYCSGTIRAGRSCRKVLRGGASVFGPGSGGTPSRRTIAAGVIRFSERHIQSRIPDAAGRHCAGSGP